MKYSIASGYDPEADISPDGDLSTDDTRPLLFRPLLGGFANLARVPVPSLGTPSRSSCHRRSGVRATVDGQIRTGEVRRFRARHEGYQRGDFVNGSVAVERCIVLLGRGPISYILTRYNY